MKVWNDSEIFTDTGPALTAPGAYLSTWFIGVYTVWSSLKSRLQKQRQETGTDPSLGRVVGFSDLKLLRRKSKVNYQI